MLSLSGPRMRIQDPGEEATFSRAINPRGGSSKHTYQSLFASLLSSIVFAVHTQCSTYSYLFPRLTLNLLCGFPESLDRPRESLSEHFELALILFSEKDASVEYISNIFLTFRFLFLVK